MIQKSKVKEYVRENEVNVASDLHARLEEKVSVLLDEAVERCKSNGRKTVSAKDL